jgi:hypothetical protein
MKYTFERGALLKRICRHGVPLRHVLHNAGTSGVVLPSDVVLVLDVDNSSNVGMCNIRIFVTAGEGNGVGWILWSQSNLWQRLA